MIAAGGVPAVITEAHLVALEDALRDAARMNRSVYEGSKEMLLRLFRCARRLVLLGAWARLVGGSGKGHAAFSLCVRKRLP